MANNARISSDDIAQVLQGNVMADTSRLAYRDPDNFVVSRLFSDVGSNRELHRNQPSKKTLYPPFHALPNHSASCCDF